MSNRHSCPCCGSFNTGYAYIGCVGKETHVVVKCANCGCCTFPMKSADDAEKLWDEMYSKCFVVRQSAAIQSWNTGLTY